MDRRGHYLNLDFNKNPDELQKKTAQLKKLLGRIDDQSDRET